MITGRSVLFALLGDPVAHSLSPAMQNAAFRVLGLDAVYAAVRCPADRVATLMRTLADAGGGGNVTVPHKAVAAEAVTGLEGGVPGACNTFWGSDGRLVGANTDVAGILGALERLEVAATSWLVVGTGGSARAVLAAAAARGVRVGVRSRSAGRRAAFLAAAAEPGLPPADEAECDLVVNATPLGLAPDDPLPITPFETPSARWVLDLVYGRGGTPMVQAYAERGVAAADGREVLVGQGAAALERWFPELEAPREVMRAAVAHALG